MYALPTRLAARKIVDEFIAPGDRVYLYGRLAFDANGRTYLRATFIRRVRKGRLNGRN